MKQSLKPAGKAKGVARKGGLVDYRAVGRNRIEVSDFPAGSALRTDLDGIVNILKYRRGVGTRSHYAFQSAVLEPVFGAPDQSGNYILQIGDSPRVAFLAHHDTVEYVSGRTILAIDKNLVIGLDLLKDQKSNALGADDGAGIWLMLEMIAAGVPGLYVIFDAEESGCVGSRAFADSAHGQDLLDTVEIAISFDRHDRIGNQVLVEMTGEKTASTAFAQGLADQLGLGYMPATGGGLTDAYEIVGVGGVREAVNITVAYRDHHSAFETLDFAALRKLRDALLTVDWSTLPVKHQPMVGRDFWWAGPSSSSYRDSHDGDDLTVMTDMVADADPFAVAEILAGYGIGPADLADMLALDSAPKSWRY